MSKYHTNQPFSDTAIRERGGNRWVIGRDLTADLPQGEV